jgi:hypothetical protein
MDHRWCERFHHALVVLAWFRNGGDKSAEHRGPDAPPI